MKLMLMMVRNAQNPVLPFFILSWLCVLVENFDLVAVNIQSLVEWLNQALPHLNMPLDASEEELRAYLIDGTVLCSILNKFCPGLVEMVGFLSYQRFCCMVLFISYIFLFLVLNFFNRNLDLFFGLLERQFRTWTRKYPKVSSSYGWIGLA
jgi:hypothetical protein